MDRRQAFLLRQELTTTAVGPKGGVIQDLRRAATITILIAAKGNKTRTGLGFGPRSFLPSLLLTLYIRMHTYY